MRGHWYPSRELSVVWGVKAWLDWSEKVEKLEEMAKLCCDREKRNGIVAVVKQLL